MVLSIPKKNRRKLHVGIQTPKQPLLKMLCFHLFCGLIKIGSHFNNLNKYSTNSVMSHRNQH